MGRLRPGRTLDQASSEMQAISGGLFEATMPSGYTAKSLDRYRHFQLEAIPAGTGVSELRTQYDSSLWLLLGLTGLVLLIRTARTWPT